ncbi:MAG: pyridoxamine 5'-phosphate oxidase family protein [Oceanococcus sp.]
MGKIFQMIDDKMADWIKLQHMFFVATAPLKQDGLINCSPKGGDSFRILSPTQVAYQDFTGSGVETIAHLKENQRMVVMFCAFEGPPKIVRLHGQGAVITQQDSEFAELSNQFPPAVGTRAFIKMDVRRISDSCGYAVPQYEFLENRDILDKWAINKGESALQDYRDENNVQSIEGLTGLE